MRQYGKITAFLAVIMVGIMYLGMSASAVNSFACTGPSDEDHHGALRGAVNDAIGELNDYYTGSGQLHVRDTNGRMVSEIIMWYQRFQPQHLILVAHGQNGRYMSMGISADHESMHADYWYAVDGIKTSNKDSLYHPGAPLGMVILGSCKSGVTSDPVNFKKAFHDEMHAWVFTGMRNKPHVWDVRKFIKVYSDEISDGKKSYKRAIELGVKATWVKQFQVKAWGWSGGYLHHSSLNDKYRKIDRTEGSEGQTLDKNGNAISFIYDRSFSGTSNGAYVVFHGICDNDIEDTTLTARIQINLYKKVNNVWTLISPFGSTTFDVQNRVCTQESIAYGGTDICSVYVRWTVLKYQVTNSGDLKVEVKFLNWGTATDVLIDRFEIMEIGR